MKIHCIETGTVAIKQSQRRGEGHGPGRRLKLYTDRRWTEPLPIYAWVIEHPEGVIVVDTGETARTSEPGYFPRVNPYFMVAVREWVRPEEEIGPQLRALGIEPSDVRWLVLTHLHTDHAGGLHHFRNVETLVTGREYQLASGFMGQVRGYVSNRFPDWFAPRTIDFQPTPLGPFPETLPLTRAGDVQLVSTPGHTAGHLSVVVREDDTYVFIAGDTSYTQQLMLDQIVDGVTPNEAQGQQTLQRILQFARDVPMVYLPTHDPDSARRLQERDVVQAGTVRPEAVGQEQ